MEKKKKLSLGARNSLVGISFIIPNFIGFFIFILIPVVISFSMSFMEWDGSPNNPRSFVGFSNFSTIFSSSDFRTTLGNSLVYTAFSVIFTLLASLGLAVVLNKSLKGTAIFRSAIFFPYVASVVAIGAVWKAMFNTNGPINLFLSFIGITDMPGWFASPQWAMPGVILVSVWRNMGYFMIVYLAALQDIPKPLYEAADIDGGNGWQKFRYITFPMLTPATFFVLLMLTINSFKIFDLIYALTEGGPGTATKMMVNYIYEQSFTYWNTGLASAAAMILFLIVGTLTVIQFRVEKKFMDYM